MTDPELADFYRRTLWDDVAPFWLRHGMDAEHGGLFSALDQDGSRLDTDKSIWVQGRTAWMYATLHRTNTALPGSLEASRSCVDFLRQHGEGPEGKLYFTVTREGAPLRMRRYAYSESFASIGNAALAAISGDDRAASDAQRYFESYLHWNFSPGAMEAKSARPAKGLGPLMIGIVTAQELRTYLGDLPCRGSTYTEWIDRWIAEIAQDFLKPDEEVLMETVAPDGSILDHFDGRLLNPGHAMEAAWFIMQEGAWRKDQRKIDLGLTILDWMWQRGWDSEFGGIFYFRDLKGLPVQEYWQDMKFWWPHNEAIIATLMAWKLTGDIKWRDRHALVHDWSFSHFADPEFGEWFGYLHRDGTRSNNLKGNMWKGPFHLPRMLLICLQLLESPAGASSLSHK
jgi:N-acylglucosamine 2-epimerase